MKPRLFIVLGLIVVVLGVGGALVANAGGPAAVFRPASASHAPSDARVRVQVLNATTVRGLGRRATDVLREHGFDVVEVGTNRDRFDSTIVLDRSGHPDWAKRVATALGGARVESRPDSSRYLDITVLVGAAWRPPAQPFHP